MAKNWEGGGICKRNSLHFEKEILGRRRKEIQTERKWAFASTNKTNVNDDDDDYDYEDNDDD